MVKNIFVEILEKDNPITIKLLKNNLKWKLILDPELEFPEAYMQKRDNHRKCISI